MSLSLFLLIILSNLGDIDVLNIDFISLTAIDFEILSLSRTDSSFLFFELKGKLGLLMAGSEFLGDFVKVWLGLLFKS